MAASAVDIYIDPGLVDAARKDFMVQPALPVAEFVLQEIEQ